MDKIRSFLWKIRVLTFVLGIVAFVITISLTEGFFWAILVGLIFTVLISVTPPKPSAPN